MAKDKNAPVEQKTNDPLAATTTQKAAFDPNAVKVTRVVTLPLLKMNDGDTVYIRCLGAIFKGKEFKGATKEGEQKMAPADLMNVQELVSDKPMQIIVNSVLKSTLTEEYPNDGYIGKAFRITRNASKAGKRYKTYNIDEIEA